MAEAFGKATARIIDTVLGGSACFALDLEAKASAELVSGRGVQGRAPKYAKDVASKTLKFLGYGVKGLKLSLVNPIPEGSGLGEAEAVSCATALAVCGAVARKHGSVNELKIDKYVHHQFILVDGRLVDRMDLIALCPGDFGRLFASFYGGFAVSDNRKKRILRRGEMETLHWIAAVQKKKMKEAFLDVYRHERELIFDECVKGNLYGAMRLSTLLYNDETAARMLSAGALAACTSYPSAVAVTRDKNKVAGISKAARGCRILTGLTGNLESRILVKPKKIVKTNEFLKIKGGQDYFFV